MQNLTFQDALLDELGQITTTLEQIASKLGGIQKGQALHDDSLLSLAAIACEQRHLIHGLDQRLKKVEHVAQHTQMFYKLK